MKQIALVGFGIENQSVYRYFSEQPDVSITICDKNENTPTPPGVATQLGDRYLEDLARFDTIIRTVGMHPSIILKSNPGVQNKITTAVNIFFESCKTPSIGVTGTKGKGTTSTLIAKILGAANKKVVLAGNIGTPMLDMLTQANIADFVVLELSSFQLADCKYSPNTGVCLMVVPEHLNWHKDMDDYKHAKANIFRFQSSGDRAVYNLDNQNSVDIASVTPATNKLTYSMHSGGDAHVRENGIYFKDIFICRIDEIALLGEHNLQNVCASIAATYDLVEGDIDAMRSVITTFSGLPHRLELVREVGGVRFYDDSFSTTPETAIAAIHAFSAPKILILGGSDKGIPFDELANIAAKKAKYILTIGETGPKIADLIRNQGFENVISEGLSDMTSIVDTAKALAEPGDVVLLSTGCASFGMFKDYKDRAAQFQEAVRNL